AGAWLLTRTPEALFAGLVPWLLLFATVLFSLQETVRKRLPGAAKGASEVGPGPLLAQFLVAVYGGYFGAGIGILMLAVLGLMGVEGIHRMNALKTLLAAAINAVAAGWFVLAGLVRWPQAVVMTLAAILGYFTAAHYAQRIPEGLVRGLVTLTGLGITLLLFARGFST
ncbi:MAG: sulfite exporter TauE/SafE family protein, partial [Terrimicrobiaceae bacterium]|nr:sulfite exporter TauE/SafE family protein [Terrimicrobiaceae bacterium]